MLIIAKTKERILHADEEDSAAADSMALLVALIKEARGEDTEEDIAATIQVSNNRLLCISTYLKIYYDDHLKGGSVIDWGGNSHQILPVC